MGFQHVPSVFPEIDDIPHAFHPAGAEGASGSQERAVGVDLVPVDVREAGVNGDGPDLQDGEDRPPVRLKVGGELDLHVALHLLLGYGQKPVHNVRHREGVVFQHLGERDVLRTFGECGVDDAHIGIVPGGHYPGERPELAAVHDIEPLQVDGVVNRSEETLRLHTEGEHRLLRVGHSELRRGRLEHVLGILRGKAQHLLAVHHGLSETVGNLHDSILSLFVADWIEIDGAGHTRQSREIIAAVLASAHLLDHDGHLLLGDDVAGRYHIALGRREIDAGIDALDGLGEKAELLVGVLGAREHIGRIHSGERLVVRVLELRGGTYRQRLANDLDEGAKRLQEFLRKVRRDELREEVAVAQVRIDHVLEAVLLDEAVEPVGGDDEGARHHHVHVLPLVIQIVFVKYFVQESEAAGLAADGAGPEP